jgi:hypothetical protein
MKPIDASVVVRITAAFAAAFTKARFFSGASSILCTHVLTSNGYVKCQFSNSRRRYLFSKWVYSRFPREISDGGASIWVLVN